MRFTVRQGMIVGSILLFALVCLPTFKRKYRTNSGHSLSHDSWWWTIRWPQLSIKYFTTPRISAKLRGQSSKEDLLMHSDFEDPEGTLVKLLKDNPDLAPEITDGLKRAKSDLSELTDGLLANVDFGDPLKAKQFFADFIKWLHEEDNE